MRTITKARLEALRAQFPKGATVALERMDDVQAPPVGTLGEVLFVDDIGTVHVAWRTGSTLGVVYGEDACRVV